MTSCTSSWGASTRRGRSTWALSRAIDHFTWDVAPLPVGKTPAGILHSDAYCLSAAATDKAAAWSFIEFANSVAGQTIIAGSGRTVPSLKAVAESPAFLDPGQPPANSRVWIATIPTLRRVPVISTWQEIEAVASEEIARAFYGEITADAAAAAAVRRTEEYFLLGQSESVP